MLGLWSSPCCHVLVDVALTHCCFALAVNMPGTYYVISSDGKTIDQMTCRADTYGPGLKKQRACVPCPTGFSTVGVLGAASPNQCGE